MRGQYWQREKQQMRTDKEANKAVLYARVSTTKQSKEGHGIASQITRCREFASYKGLEVVETFTDERSGSLIDRPGMKAMLDYLRRRKSGEYVVIIDDISRLARSISAHISLRTAISRVGAELLSPSIEFGEDPDSVLIENVLASISQHHAQKNGQTAVNRMRARLLGGYAVFPAPIGYRYEATELHGKILVRDEPSASIIQEALEGYATGRFETQAEVQRFFESKPHFPFNKNGRVRPQRVTDILTRVTYAGYIEHIDWNVSLRPGHHEGLITLETFEAIQERRNSRPRTPVRKNISEDYPLRGAVDCECGKPLKSGWSRGRHGKRYAYYVCQTKDCQHYGKSIRKADIENAFREILRGLTPTRDLMPVLFLAFSDVWEKRTGAIERQRRAMRTEIQQLERQAERAVDLLVEAEGDVLTKNLEKRLQKIERSKALLEEKIKSCGRALPTFEDGARTAIQYIGNPCNLWDSERLEDKRLAVKLAFSERPRYTRENGFLETELSLPIKLLTQIDDSGSKMVGPEGLEPPTKRL